MVENVRFKLGGKRVKGNFCRSYRGSRWPVLLYVCTGRFWYGSVKNSTRIEGDSAGNKLSCKWFWIWHASFLSRRRLVKEKLGIFLRPHEQIKLVKVKTSKTALQTREMISLYNRSSRHCVKFGALYTVLLGVFCQLFWTGTWRQNNIW